MFARFLHFLFQLQWIPSIEISDAIFFFSGYKRNVKLYPLVCAVSSWRCAYTQQRHKKKNVTFQISYEKLFS